MVLGDRPASLLQTVVGFDLGRLGVCRTGNHEGKAIRVLVVTHPYSDLGKTDQAKQAEADILQDACGGLSLG